VPTDAPPASPTSRWKGTPGASGSDVLWLVLLGTIWGSAFPVIRFGIVDGGVSPLPLGAARFALAAALLLGLSFRRGGQWPTGREAAKLALIGGMLFVGGYAAFLNIGEQTISSGLSAVLVGTLPLWTVLFGLLLVGGERIGRLGALGIAAGFAGLLVLFLPNVFTGFSSFTEGELWVLGAPATAALGTVLIRRYVPGSPGTRGLTIEFAAAAAMLGALSFVPGMGHALPFKTDAWAAIVYLAVLPSAVGFAIYFELLRRVGAVGANLVSYVNPLAGVAIGIVLLGEGVTLTEAGGFVLVVVGLGLFQYGRNRARRNGTG
jgi:probable blue pigment (indigoidine) exporter